MAQAAPTKGREIVYPEAIAGLEAFVSHAKPELEFALDTTIERLQERVQQGRDKYGTFLMTFNGRNAVQDAWEEAADLVFYLEQVTMELPLPQQYAWQDIADLAREALLLLTEQRVKQETGLGR